MVTLVSIAHMRAVLPKTHKRAVSRQGEVRHGRDRALCSKLQFWLISFFQLDLATFGVTPPSAGETAKIDVLGCFPRGSWGRFLSISFSDTSDFFTLFALEAVVESRHLNFVILVLGTYCTNFQIKFGFGSQRPKAPQK